MKNVLMAEYVIGIDVGTGSTKALAIDANGKLLSSFQVSYSLLDSSDGYCEQDPVVIWKAFTQCIRHFTDTLKEEPRAVAISTAMHSVIAMDKQGKPLTNMITWADNRAASIAQRIRQSSSGEMIYEQTGTPIHAMSPLCKIIWMRENDSHTFQSTHKFISIKEYLWFRLFDVYEVDYSIASATGLMDIISLTWNSNSISLCGIDEDQLSKLVDTNHIRNGIAVEAARETTLTSDVSFIIGSSDGCMANLGSFATEPGVAALTIGTSGAIRVASKTPIYNFEAMTFNYRLDTETFICGGPSNNGGIVLKWYAENFLKKQLTSSQDYHQLLDKIGSIPAGSDGLVLLPYLLGERAPLWDSGLCGVFFGIQSRHTQEHFTRAVVEGISMALYHIADKMQAGGLDIDQVNVSGGFVHSPEWLQILADIFGKKINLINTSDASAMGAAFLGLKTLNLVNDYQMFRSKTSQVIMPDLKNSKIYRQQFKIYESLCTSLMSLMHSRSTNN
jgi:gluconokinase